MPTLEELAQRRPSRAVASVLIEEKGTAEQLASEAKPTTRKARNSWDTRQIDVADLLAEAPEASSQQRLEALLDRVGPTSGVHFLVKGGGERDSDEVSPSPNVCIGRAKRNDVVIADDAISSVHALFDCSEQQALRDNGSSNGTFVNGHLLRDGDEVTLRSGDCVRLAERVFYYLTGPHLEAFLDLYRNTRGA